MCDTLSLHDALPIYEGLFRVGDRRSAIVDRESRYKRAWDAYVEFSMDPGKTIFDCIKAVIDAVSGHAQRQLDPSLIERLHLMHEWMREPDYAEDFSLVEMAIWINRRDITLLPQVLSAVSSTERGIDLDNPDSHNLLHGRRPYLSSTERCVCAALGKDNIPHARNCPALSSNERQEPKP
jgi:hypothetical protein